MLFFQIYFSPFFFLRWHLGLDDLVILGCGGFPWLTVALGQGLAGFTEMDLALDIPRLYPTEGCVCVVISWLGQEVFPAASSQPSLTPANSLRSGSRGSPVLRRGQCASVAMLPTSFRFTS